MTTKFGQKNRLKYMNRVKGHAEVTWGNEVNLLREIRVNGATGALVYINKIIESVCVCVSVCPAMGFAMLRRTELIFSTMARSS